MSDSKLHGECEGEVCSIDEPEKTVDPPVFSEAKAVDNFIKAELYFQKDAGEKVLLEKKDLLETEFMTYVKQYVRKNNLEGGKLLLSLEWPKYIPRSETMESGVLDLDSDEEESDEDK
jgi:hypothetical protein